MKRAKAIYRTPSKNICSPEFQPNSFIKLKTVSLKNKQTYFSGLQYDLKKRQAIIRKRIINNQLLLLSKDYYFLYLKCSACQQTDKQNISMLKSNFQAAARQKYLSKNTQMKSEQPQYLTQSKTKMPVLQKMINQWKVENHQLSKCAHLSQLALQSGIVDRETIIKALEKKIDALENKLIVVSQKHGQICSMLCKEIQKKSSFESTLRRQNEQLNKMLKVVMQQAKKLVSRLYNKDEARKSQQIKIMINPLPESNKQNTNQINVYNSKRLGNNLLRERRRSRSRKMNIFSNPTKSKIAVSHDKSYYQEDANKMNKISKKNQIERSYYNNNEKNEPCNDKKVKNHKILSLFENYSTQSPLKII